MLLVCSCMLVRLNENMKNLRRKHFYQDHHLKNNYFKRVFYDHLFNSSLFYRLLDGFNKAVRRLSQKTHFRFLSSIHHRLTARLFTYRWASIHKKNDCYLNFNKIPYTEIDYGYETRLSAVSRSGESLITDFNIDNESIFRFGIAIMEKGAELGPWIEISK